MAQRELGLCFMVLIFMASTTFESATAARTLPTLMLDPCMGMEGPIPGCVHGRQMNEFFTAVNPPSRGCNPFFRCRNG
ncbi:hypothetical protein QJS10_CPA10g01501 [Acorus calamus]|uniref:Uncharacterized protein n=1 Tax=Acorus calamus TaxID=4465 RepID=A0AAV9E1K5_ACOCL|nr:hypothetical protein QJS10_CPA10g01501 [Acorus calamus]